MTGAPDYKFTIAVSPLDCMGCGVCVSVCPAKEKALVMKPQESQSAQQEVFDFMVANISKKPGMPADETVKGSQFNQPLLEFSGSCAGCAETSYARLITQLFGERMYISNATGCSSIWGGPAAPSPYTVNKDTGRGPTWANSLFEDNAEHGFGMYIGQKTIRDRLAAKRWLLHTAVWCVPLAYLASQTGWIVAEAGRQPWAIQDLMPVGVAASKIPSGSVATTFFLFLALFTALLVAELSIMFRQIKIGPKNE